MLNSIQRPRAKRSAEHSSTLSPPTTPRATAADVWIELRDKPWEFRSRGAQPNPTRVYHDLPDQLPRKDPHRTRLPPRALALSRMRQPGSLDRCLSRRSLQLDPLVPHPSLRTVDELARSTLLRTNGIPSRTATAVQVARFRRRYARCRHALLHPPFIEGDRVASLAIRLSAMSAPVPIMVVPDRELARAFRASVPSARRRVAVVVAQNEGLGSIPTSGYTTRAA